MALALQLDPNLPLVRMRYAVSGLMPHDRLKEATKQLERALEVDPLYLLARFWLAIMYLLDCLYEQASRKSENCSVLMSTPIALGKIPIALPSARLRST